MDTVYIVVFLICVESSLLSDQKLFSTMWDLREILAVEIYRKN
jgi:hypothetical protein